MCSEGQGWAASGRRVSVTTSLSSGPLGPSCAVTNVRVRERSGFTWGSQPRSPAPSFLRSLSQKRAFPVGRTTETCCAIRKPSLAVARNQRGVG